MPDFHNDLFFITALTLIASIFLNNLFYYYNLIF